jgi:methionyl-tRNA formyltransferase
VAQPRSLRLDGKYPEEAAAGRDALLAAQPDVMVVAAYGLILPQWVLDLPQARLPEHPRLAAAALARRRAHPPRHRGRRRTDRHHHHADGRRPGHRRHAAARSSRHRRRHTARLHDRLAELGGRMIVDALANGRPAPCVRTPQPADGVTYATRSRRHEALIDWAQPADAIVRRVRAFDPFPGANSPLDGETVKLWTAHAAVAAADASAAPGTILAVSDTGVAVAAAGSTVMLTELQRPGGKRLAVADFLRGFDLKAGQVFG